MISEKVLDFGQFVWYIVPYFMDCITEKAMDIARTTGRVGGFAILLVLVAPLSAMADPGGVADPDAGTYTLDKDSAYTGNAGWLMRARAWWRSTSCRLSVFG